MQFKYNFCAATFGKAASAVAKAEGKDPIDVMRETPNSEYYNEARFGECCRLMLHTLAAQTRAVCFHVAAVLMQICLLLLAAVLLHM